MTAAARMTWQETYDQVAERLSGQAEMARLIFTGTSACVDAIFRIDAGGLSRLFAQPGAESGPGADLAARVLSRITQGRGGELVTRWPGGPAWVCGLLGQPDRYQVGGTGPQASWALAAIGARSVLALADRSAEQLAVVDPRTGVCAGGTIVAAGSLAPSGTPAKLPHCILEFTAGTRHAGMVIPRSSRIILRFGDEPIERDEQYRTMTTNLARTASAGLVSGLNGLCDGDRAGQAWTRELAGEWSAAGLAVVHHELGEFRSPQRLQEAAALGTATSLGMSLSELFMLAGSRGDPRLLAHEAALHYRVPRVIVHADDWALAVHRADPRHEAGVLLAANLVASARARAGQPAARLDPAAGASYTDDLPPGGTLTGGWRVTSVPAPYLPQPAGTIGLGDTFTAGLLLAESLPP
jgi:ADP-specific Phosphofructokinase/Glucokinase conserved region